MDAAFPTHFCIVDDDQEFATFLADYLRARGAKAVVFSSAEDFLRPGEIADFDFFIIDLGLPGIDGVDLITLVRAQSTAGILVISGRMGPDAFNSALAAGADMFVNKPVRFDQVYHAVASVHRRIIAMKPKGERWLLDPGRRLLISPDGREIALSPIEQHMMQVMQAAGTEPVGRADLSLLKPDSPAGENRNFDAAIFRFRRKIERETGQQAPFRTVHGIGYQLAEPVDLQPKS